MEEGVFSSSRLRGLLQFEAPLPDSRPTSKAQPEPQRDSGWLPRVLEFVGLAPPAARLAPPASSASATTEWLPGAYLSFMTPAAQPGRASEEVECLGIVVQEEDDSEVRVCRITNAALAGDLRIGDTILGIDGTMVYRDPLPGVGRLLHGKPGSVVSLHLLRRTAEGSGRQDVRVFVCAIRGECRFHHQGAAPHLGANRRTHAGDYWTKAGQEKEGVYSSLLDFDLQVEERKQRTSVLPTLASNMTPTRRDSARPPSAAPRSSLPRDLFRDYQPPAAAEPLDARSPVASVGGAPRDGRPLSLSDSMLRGNGFPCPDAVDYGRYRESVSEGLHEERARLEEAALAARLQFQQLNALRERLKRDAIVKVRGQAAARWGGTPEVARRVGTPEHYHAVSNLSPTPRDTPTIPEDVSPRETAGNPEDSLPERRMDLQGMSGGGGERGWESTGEDGEWTGVDEYTEAGGDSEYSGESSAATPDSETPDLEPLWEKKLPARPEQPEQEAAGTPGVWEVDLYDSDAPVHQAMPDAAAAKAADAAPAGHTSGSNGSNAAPAGPVRVTVTVSGLGVAHLPKMDRMGKCDPYVVVEVKGEGGGSGNAVQRTATIKNRYDAAFAETFLFAGVDVALDAADGLSSSSAASAGRAHLVLRVMDWDRFGKDEEVGRTVITLDRKSVGILGAEKSAETLLTSPSGKVAQGHDGQPTVISFTLAFSGLPQEPAHPTVALDFSAAGQVVSSPPATHSPPVVEVSPPATRSPPVLEGLPSRSSLGSISSDDESSPSVASGVEFSQRSPWRVERLTGDYSTIAEDAEGEGGEERGTVSRYHGGEDVSRGPRGEGGGGVGAAHLEPRELYSTPKAEHAANGGGGGSEARGGGSAERGARNLASQVPWAGTPSSGKKEAGEWKVSVELHQVINLPKMDRMGSADPYVCCSVVRDDSPDGARLLETVGHNSSKAEFAPHYQDGVFLINPGFRSQTLPNRLSASFEESFSFVATQTTPDFPASKLDGIFDVFLVMTCWDANKNSPDTLIGAAVVGLEPKDALTNVWVGLLHNRCPVLGHGGSTRAQLSVTYQRC